MKVYHWMDRCWSSAFPPRCVLCLAPGNNAMALCEDCLQDLPWHQAGCRVCSNSLAAKQVPPAVDDQGLLCGQCLKNRPVFDRVLAALDYASPVDYLVRRFKFNATLHVGRLLGELFLYRCAPTAVDALVPVPLHFERLKLRGFNQSEELSRFFAQVMDVAHETSCLQRTRDSIAQSTLLAVDRRRAMAGMFKAHHSVAGKHIALVDDVLTTGSTANACAQALRSAGAASVQVWAISRA